MKADGSAGPAGAAEAAGGAQPDTRERILAAAEALVIAKGTKGTSLADIATTAGISRGTLFYHYRAKEDLLFDLAERHMGSVTGRIMQTVRARGEHPGREGRAAALALLVSELCSDAARSRMHHYLILEALDGNERIRTRLAASYRSWLDLLRDEGAEGGRIGETAASLVVAILDGVIIQNALGLRAGEAETVAETLVSLLERG